MQVGSEVGDVGLGDGGLDAVVDEVVDAEVARGADEKVLAGDRRHAETLVALEMTR